MLCVCALRPFVVTRCEKGYPTLLNLHLTACEKHRMCTLKICTRSLAQQSKPVASSILLVAILQLLHQIQLVGIKACRGANQASVQKVLEEACSALEKIPDAFDELQRCRLEMTTVLMCMAGTEDAPSIQKAFKVIILP